MTPKGLARIAAGMLLLGSSAPAFAEWKYFTLPAGVQPYVSAARACKRYIDDPTWGPFTAITIQVFRKTPQTTTVIGETWRYWYDDAGNQTGRTRVDYQANSNWLGNASGVGLLMDRRPIWQVGYGDVYTGRVRLYTGKELTFTYSPAPGTPFC